MDGEAQKAALEELCDYLTDFSTDAPYHRLCRAFEQGDPGMPLTKCWRGNDGYYIFGHHGRGGHHGDLLFNRPGGQSDGPDNKYIPVIVGTTGGILA